MRIRFVLAIITLAAATTVAAQSGSVQAQAEAAHAKLQAVMGGPATEKNTAKPTTKPAAKPTAKRHTVFSQTEMNAYLRTRATWLPSGLTEPSVQFIGANRIATLVTADLDGVRRKSSGGWFDPTSYLSGRLPVSVTGTLSTGDGRGQFVLERATVDGIPVPQLFIDELLAFYTRSADNPAGMRLAEPFDLPSEIERIDVATGQATVIQ